MRKNICFCLALMMLLSTMSMLVGAVDFSSVVIGTSEFGVVEPKVLSTATVEEDFADNHVLVVLNNKASLNFKTYSVSDFKEVKCAAVQDLSTGKKKQVETKVNDFKNSVRTMSAESKAAAVEEINTYNQIICLELADKGKANVLAAIKALQSRDDVMYAGPDYMIELCSSTTEDTYRDEQWAIENIHLDDAWDITTGTSSVIVGVLDTGIDASHPDLQGKIATVLCADFTTTYPQYTVPPDVIGHGTHVAGIIAATTNNDQGIAGAASGIKIAAFRVFDANNQGWASKVALAIDYAEEIGLQIINFSGDWYFKNPRYDYALNAIINNYSGLFICSAGNENRIVSANPDPTTATDGDVIYPASLTNSNILVVGASTQSKERASFSNYGAASVDVFAPGESIMSCFPTTKCLNGTCEDLQMFAGTHRYNGYHSVPGTSMAAPYVSGIAALMLSENPGLTPLQIKNKIIETCTDDNSLTDKCVSGGIVNAYQAVLNAHTHTTVSANSSRTVSLSAGRSCWFKFTASAAGTYSFYTTGSQDTEGKLFSPTFGLLADSNNVGTNFCVTSYLSAFQTVYLRVNLEPASASGIFTLYVDAE